MTVDICDDRYRIYEDGRIQLIRGRYAGRFMSFVQHKQGYLMVGITRSDGKRKTSLVHRVVLEAFTKPSAEQVNHKNGVKSDNRLSNLEWCSSKMNIAHSISVLGCFKHGENNGQSKLTEKDISRAREAAFFGAQSKDLAHTYGMSTAAMNKAIRGVTWCHVV